LLLAVAVAVAPMKAVAAVPAGFYLILQQWQSLLIQ
jgi:hypothetical protein